MLRTTPNPLLARRPSGEATPGPTILRRTSARRTMLRALEVRNAVRELDRLPDVDEYVHIVMRMNFPLWSIVPAILRLAAPATIEDLAVATLGFNTSNAHDLMAMLDDGRIGRVLFLCSVYFEKANGREFAFLAEGLRTRGHRIAAARSHAKVVAVSMSDGRAFVVESSANLRSCRNLEQMTMTQGRDIYEFHAGWIGELVEAHT